jgi:hypothetical protein
MGRSERKFHWLYFYLIEDFSLPSPRNDIRHSNAIFSSSSVANANWENTTVMMNGFKQSVSRIRERNCCCFSCYKTQALLIFHAFTDMHFPLFPLVARDFKGAA